MKFLIPDCDGICWAIYHSIPPLTHEGQHTEIIYGFLNQLFYFQEFNRADVVVFCWDSKFSHRTNLFPGYKRGRRDAKKAWTPQEQLSDNIRRQQFKLLRAKILPSLGFRNIMFQQGYEADDMIASVVSSLGSNDSGKIISRDKDLLQLVSNNCSMYDWIEGKLHTPESVFERFRIWPDTWAQMMSMAGCTTDEIPGVPGVGVDRAVRFLLKELKPTSKTYQRIVNGCDEIELTRLLTTLPFEGAKPYTICKDECSPDKLRAIAREYNFKSYLSRLSEFKELFCANKTKTG